MIELDGTCSWKHWVESGLGGIGYWAENHRNVLFIYLFIIFLRKIYIKVDFFFLNISWSITWKRSSASTIVDWQCIWLFVRAVGQGMSQMLFLVLICIYLFFFFFGGFCKMCGLNEFLERIIYISCIFYSLKISGVPEEYFTVYYKIFVI